MSQRDIVPAGREPSNQIEPAGELRRDGDDPDVRRRALDLGEDVGAVEGSLPPDLDRPRASRYGGQSAA